MAYTINYSDTNKGTISIEDSTINQQTSLDIPGRNTTSYGSVIAENFLNNAEFAGVNFAPDGKTLFVNIYSPTMTIAITGPWEDLVS